eukprot:2310966-Rhodomonas_salina.1
MSVDGPSREAKSACWTLQGERIGAEVEQERARKVREGLEREEAQLKRMLFSAPGVPKHPLSQQRVGIGLELMPFDGGRERGPVVNCKSRLTLCHAPRHSDNKPFDSKLTITIDACCRGFAGIGCREAGGSFRRRRSARGRRAIR